MTPPPRGRPGFTGQVFGFAVVGVLSTLAFLLAYLALRTALPAVTSNAIALLATTIANTAANRRFSFGIRSRHKAVRHQIQGLVVFGAALLITSGSLVAVHALVGEPSRLVEVAALITANLAATCLRFVLLRHWVFGVPRRGAERGGRGAAIRLPDPPSPNPASPNPAPDQGTTDTVHLSAQRSER
jgi:putative flippase GtrA